MIILFDVVIAIEVVDFIIQPTPSSNKSSLFYFLRIGWIVRVKDHVTISFRKVQFILVALSLVKTNCIDDKMITYNIW